MGIEQELIKGLEVNESQLVNGIAEIQAQIKMLRGVGATDADISSLLKAMMPPEMLASFPEGAMESEEFMTSLLHFENVSASEVADEARKGLDLLTKE
jgi:hypothetical protein